MPSTTQNLLGIFGVIGIIMGLLLLIIEEFNYVISFFGFLSIMVGIISLSKSFGAL